jgi:hypothetical protein
VVVNEDRWDGVFNTDDGARDGACKADGADEAPEEAVDRLVDSSDETGLTGDGIGAFRVTNKDADDGIGLAIVGDGGARNGSGAKVAVSGAEDGTGDGA